ncbi:programmed cell death protein 2 [Hysterangium stoloniferum]|nr:programmed cell death protein 2 [Hysterangium stoloniferum]
MAPQIEEDDWSDSDDDDLSVSEIETSVLLGIPDGVIEETEDVSDPSVSRMGGHPAFLPATPLEPSKSYCKLCTNPMPLLVQMWCPFEGSAMDRALYVWGCDRTECQRKDGSVRAWRGLKFNSKYAAKLEKKKVREEEQRAKKAAEQAKLEAENKNRSVNPFSLSSGASSQMSFGLGTQLFGAPSPSTNTDKAIDEERLPASPADSSSAGSENEADVNALVGQLEATKLESAEFSPEWLSSPSYNPVYLSTISEYIAPPPKSKQKAEHLVTDDLEDNRPTGQDWGLEGWEKSIDVDGVFDKFTKRVSSDPEQCVRYDLKGTPLPYGSRDSVYNRLFPPPPPAPFTTKPGYAAPLIQRRTYNFDAVGDCDVCGGRRVFECQLMPNLINVLRAQRKEKETKRIRTEEGADKSVTEEERRKAILDVGMEWGTCFIFSCEKDCCPGEEGWREEKVLVQWDV